MTPSPEERLHAERRRAVWILVILVLLGVGTIVALGLFYQVDLNQGTWNSRSEPLATSTQEAQGSGTDETTPPGTEETPSAALEPSPTSAPGGAFPYLGWFLAALLGTIGFLIGEVVSWYPKLDLNDTREEVSFRRYTLWYAGNLVKGPVIVVLILVVLVNINLNVGTGGDDGTVGLGINFGELPPIVILALALMLGVYSRTARVQLDLIMKRLLPEAWRESHLIEGQFVIQGSTALTLATTTYYVLSTQAVATWKITYCSPYIQSISLWADDQSAQKLEVADLLTHAFSGIYLYVKVEEMELPDGQESGKLILQATVEDQKATLEITVS